jgi:hypothetical protein
LVLGLAEIAREAGAFRSLCQRHHKRESQHHVNGCCASRTRLHYPACHTTVDRTGQHIGNEINPRLFLRGRLRKRASGRLGQRHGFNRQGQAHIVSTAIRSPVPARGPAEVGGKPWFRAWFSIDPQPASISPTVNISIVFICGLILIMAASFTISATKNDSSAIPQSPEWQNIGNQINAAFILCGS